MAKSADFDRGYAQDWRAAVFEHAISFAVNHPIRLDCLAILIDRVASAKEIAAELGISVRTVGHHISKLHAVGAVRRVKSLSGGNRRGASEHFYEAVTRPQVSAKEWRRMARSGRREVAARSLLAIVALGLSALGREGVETDDRFRVGWLAIPADKQGEDEVADLLEETLERAAGIKAENAHRLEKAGEDGKTRIVAVLGFAQAAPRELPPQR